MVQAVPLMHALWAFGNNLQDQSTPILILFILVEETQVAGDHPIALYATLQEVTLIEIIFIIMPETAAE